MTIMVILVMKALKAYKDKTGNVAEINLMLTAMLRYAGLNANPVLVSTRSNGIAMFPNRTAFNYVIAAVENGGNYTLLTLQIFILHQMYCLYRH
jgi:hypothetical protein